MSRGHMMQGMEPRGRESLILGGGAGLGFGRAG